jgi:type I restriction enzyme S subunit
MEASTSQVMRVIETGQVPSDWNRMTIQELLSGGSLELVQDGNHGGNYPKQDDFSNSGIPLITGADIEGGIINFGSCKFLKPDRAAKLRIGFAKTDDVLLSHKGTMGKTAIVPSIATPYIILNPQLTLYRVSNDGVIDRHFLKYFFDSPTFQSFLARISAISTISTLSLGLQKQLEIPLPSKAEQHAVVAILRAFDDKIELNQRMNETLEAMARAISKDWFVDFGPTRAKMEGRGRYLAPEIWALFPDRLDDKGKPEGWRRTVIEDLLGELETGGRPKGGVSGYTDGVPSVGAESIVGLGKFDYAKTKYIPKEFFDGMNRGHVKSRDVLLYKDGGRPGEFEPHLTLVGDGFPFDTFAINEHVYRLRAKPDFGQALLYFWLSSDLAMEERRIKGTGVAIPGLNSTQVKSLTTLVPTPDVARSFDIFVEPMISRILANCNEAQSLTKMRDLLLPKLMSGEMRVNESKKEVQAVA